jgi:hypothetical protein
MTNVFIIHGSYGHPKENWFPWLKKELEKLGCTVFVPNFPTPENQTLENWIKVFEKYENHIDTNSIFVGHSLGCAFILSLLNKLEIPKPTKATFLIAGSLSSAGNPQFDNINKTFIEKKFNWPTIKNNCKMFYVYHSDNDSYLPLTKGKDLAKQLGVELKVIKDAGHFNEKAGYTSFQILLDDIKKKI